MGLFSRKRKQNDALIEYALTRNMDIFRDCLKIMGETTNPATFFSRLRLAERKLQELAEAYRRTDRRSYQEILALQREFAKEKSQIIIDLIDRMVLGDKGDFLTDLWQYREDMPQESIDYLLWMLHDPFEDDPDEEDVYYD